MTEVETNGTVAVRLPGGVVDLDVGPAVMGPPGLRGPRGERGDPGGTTTIVFSFSQRSPADLPEDGLIPAGWDDVRSPEADLQVGVGQSVENRADHYLWVFLGPSAIPGGWIETGQMRGPPGDQGPVGDTGPQGPVGDRGLTGNTGSPGPKGDQGDTGPQGARGADGQTGAPGATGPKGDRGDTGALGPEGPAGPQGEPGTPGSDGQDGADGEPGAPSFIVMDVYTRSASDVATIASGLIPANFDGEGKPAAPYQMKVGEAVLMATPGDPYLGQAIVFTGGTGATPQNWLAMKVTGPQGDQGDQGPQGIQGPQGPIGPDGLAGNLWHWYPIDPPTPGIGVPGDMILVLSPGSPDMPGNGNVYRVQLGGGYTLDGNIRGPAGPQGPPGEVQWADIIPIVARLDALTARVDRLESFQFGPVTSDRVLTDNADVDLTTIVIPAGTESAGSAHLTFELTDPAAAARVIIAWIYGIGDTVITGPASGQITLHQALPYGTLGLGPVRASTPAGGVGNAVLAVRAVPLGGGPYTGSAVLKAATSAAGTPPATARTQASGLIAR
jgi:hypothetical protein